MFLSAYELIGNIRYTLALLLNLVKPLLRLYVSYQNSGYFSFQVQRLSLNDLNKQGLEYVPIKWGPGGLRLICFIVNLTLREMKQF